MHIELQNIHKYFGVIKANYGVSLTLRPGHIHGLLGENGAGKTTLMKILSGYQSKDRGEILIDGHPNEFKSPAEAIRVGIGMLHQDPLDFPPMTALENFMLGFDQRLMPDQQAGRQQMLELAERFNFSVDPDTPVEYLTVGERQQLEISRLLALGVEVIILDEPTTGISAPQKVLLFKTLKHLAYEENKSVVFVSHKLEEVESLCDEITVLRRGEVQGHQDMPVPIEELVRLMFGQSVAMPAKTTIELGNIVLKVTDLTIQSEKFTIENANLETRAGEVIGFAGMEGSGQALFLRSIAGLQSVKQGEVFLGGKSLTGQSYRQFMAQGISLLPADRIDEGLVKGLSIAEHFPLRRETPFVIDWDENQTYTQEQIDFFNIKGRPETLVDSLSGGNQQRVLLALQQPALKVLILEHPTRGLDIESARWVWEQLLKRREKGTTILFTSADLDEIMTYSDRVVVFFSGKMIPPISVDELSVEELGYMIGGKQKE
ncbi:MAG: ATP-binding cassette domain-containing protein [Anaerolineae bacterium]|nr:ATP-binding cassette domain-containing protein [Anaerolineae bacterium]